MPTVGDGRSTTPDHAAQTTGQGSSRPVYHRLESPTQTSADAVLQTRSGEIWGRPARGSSIPSVKAYRNALPSGDRGIEFTTTVHPTPGTGTPFEARWYLGSPGVLLRQINPDDFAAIPAIVRNMQVP